MYNKIQIHETSLFYMLKGITKHLSTCFSSKMRFVQHFNQISTFGLTASGNRSEKRMLPSNPVNKWILFLQARIQKFFKGGGVEKENFERKMFIDTRINTCTHKN